MNGKDKEEVILQQFRLRIIPIRVISVTAGMIGVTRGPDFWTSLEITEGSDELRS